MEVLTIAWDDTKATNDYLSATEWNAHVTDQKGHSSRHENTGADEINIAGLSGEAADAQTPKDHGGAHESGGGDVLDGTMAFQYEKMTHNPGTDQTGSGFYIQDTLGQAASVGDLLYRKSDAKWYRADADDVLSMPCAAMAMQTKGADTSTNLLMQGFFRNDDWSLTTGALLYAGTTAGSAVMTAPAGTGDQVQIIGFVVSAATVFFNPSYEMVEIS
jgi:hypothetical protein